MGLKEKAIKRTTDFLKNRLKPTVIDTVNRELEPTRIKINLMLEKYQKDQQLVKELKELLEDLELKEE